MIRLTLPYWALGVLGFLVGIVGTGAHRYKPYWGLVCALGLVLSATVFARAWKSYTGQAVFSLTWGAVALPLAFAQGPGGSTLVWTDTLGKWWLVGGGIAAIAPVFIPRRLLEERVEHG